MGPPAVVVLDLRPKRSIEMPPTEDERPVEALGPDRLDHALGVGVGVRSPDGGADDPHPLRAEHRVEQAAELRVPVSDEEPDEPNSHVRIVGFVPPKLTRPPPRMAGMSFAIAPSDVQLFNPAAA